MVQDMGGINTHRVGESPYDVSSSIWFYAFDFSLEDYFEDYYAYFE